MLRLSTALALVASLLWLAPPVSAQSLQYSVLLDGPSEAPPNASPGIGVATIDLDLTAHTLHIDIAFSGLLGTTTVAHIHAPTVVPFTGTASVATQTPSFAGWPSGVTAGVYDNTFDLTLASSWNPAYIAAHGGTPASAELAFAAHVAEGRAYFNIHTSAFPGGEIRGFLVAVPEPSTYALIAAGAAGFGAYRWRRLRAKSRRR